MPFLETLGLAETILGGLNTAMDPKADGIDRVMGGAKAGGAGLTAAGSAATGASVMGAGGLSLPTVGSIISGGGVAGLGMGALATGGVLASGALGYSFGKEFDKAGGRAMGGTRTVQQRGVGAGTKQVNDDRTLSDRIAGTYEDQSDWGRDLALSASPYMPQWLGGDGWW